MRRFDPAERENMLEPAENQTLDPRKGPRFKNDEPRERLISHCDIGHAARHDTRLNDLRRR